MKKFVLQFLFLSVLLASCARGISPYEAANGKAKCGRYLNVDSGTTAFVKQLQIS